MSVSCLANVSESERSRPTDPSSRTDTLAYFVFAVLGFSFWFFMVVPFASHRESYAWLGMVYTEPFAHAFGYISSTYRPLAQATTWLAFRILDPGVFPTSVLRQALLQGFVYGMFVFAWWLIYSASPNRRLFALIAFVAGGVFFSGYVHLFHIYGIFYIPVILTLGTLLYFNSLGSFDQREVWFAVVATLLVLWHPFAAALFVAFYFGFYLDTFSQRSKGQHIQAVAILLVGAMAIAGMVVMFPRLTTMLGTFPRATPMPLGTRLLGLLVSYQTNEINRVASLVAFVLAQMVVLSMRLSPRAKSAAVLVVSVLSIVFLWNGLPILFVWVCAVLVKLLRLRRWSLFFLMLAAALLPFGGALGTPIYVLFAIIVAVYVTPLGWSEAEQTLSHLKTGYVIATIAALAIVVSMVRVGVDVPVVTKAASPLLTERERTYQLENVLAWLHGSGYCGYEIAFAQNADIPVEDVESAITRRNRPPALIEDVQLFWKDVLQCPNTNGSQDHAGTAFVTFGSQPLADSTPVFKIAGRYAGDATVWIEDPQR